MRAYSQKIDARFETMGNAKRQAGRGGNSLQKELDASSEAFAQIPVIGEVLVFPGASGRCRKRNDFVRSANGRLRLWSFSGPVPCWRAKGPDHRIGLGAHFNAGEGVWQ